jgi:hypothetical protein
MLRVTTDELARHRGIDDCWMAVHGNVYDVTAYLDEHPGGVEVMMDVAGTDATLEFEEVGHSHAARRELELYLIGELLAPEPEAALPERAQDARLDGVGPGASERDELYTEPPASVAGRANSGGPGARAWSALPSVVTWTLCRVRSVVHEVHLKAKHGADVYLVGTAHVSMESADDVRRAIQAHKPNVVALELCEVRRVMLHPMAPQGNTFSKVLAIVTLYMRLDIVTH